jgi:hypothetical protein
MTFKRAFRAILLVVVVHITFLALGTYDRISDIDLVLHFAGGFVIAMLGIAVHYRMVEHHGIPRIPDWYHITFVLGFVMLIGVAWEFHEYVLDNTAAIWWNWTRTQISLTDTMVDLVMDFVGGVVAFKHYQRQL